VIARQETASMAKRMRKRRIQKKFHRYWLELDIVDLSQHQYWREQLFNSNVSEPIDISVKSCDGLTSNILAALRKYKLEYTVSKEKYVDSTLYQSTLNQFVIFEFRSKKFPSVKISSINNTNIA
jgi:hypothetical protein